MRVRLNTGGATSVGGKIFASLFGLVFAGFGVAFIVLMARPMPHLYAPWSWPSAECTIEESRWVPGPEGGDRDEAYRFEVRYRYAWQGQEHVGTVLRRGYRGGKSPSDAERLVARYPAGSVQRCYVDPEAPAEAVLTRPSFWPLLVVIFPLLFVGFGALLVVGVWKRGSADGAATTPRVAPLAGKDASAGQAFGCLAAFFSIFALAGLAFFIPFFGLPMWRIAQAQRWNAVPCTVTQSEVASHSSSDGGPTYSVDVTYRYAVDGHEYLANRYDFMTGSSSGRGGKEAVVAALPPGTETTCYVNPADPTDAVLDRGFGSGMLFGLIPLVFVVVGLGGIVFAGRMARAGAGARGAARWVPGVRAAAAAPALGVSGMRELLDEAHAVKVLRPQQSALGKVGCALVLALFVGGLVGAFVYKGVLEPLQQGSRPDGCVTLFLVPFALLALAAIVNVPYQILAFFNPRSRLELEPGIVRPGERGRLRWRFTGFASRLRRVVITLEGSEEATHRVGTTTRTDTSIFLRLTLVDCEQPEQIANGGEAALALPASAMHSFSASRNKITYKLKLHGTIDRWPDVMDEFAIEVGPEGVRS